MNEEFTSLTFAYLLGQMDADASAAFEARLAANGAEAAEVRAIADTLGRYAVADSGGVRPNATERAEMSAAILEQIRPPRRISWARLAWPAAAAVLLGLNVAQWIQAHRVIEENVGLSDPATADRALDVPPYAGAHPQHAGLTRGPLAKNVPTPVPAIRQSVVFSITQTTAVTRATTPATGPLQQGSIDLHNLPKVSAERRLYLWALRTRANEYEPVGEIPRQIYGGSGTIAYQLRPGVGSAAKFEITIENTGAGVPAKPSSDIVCSGP